jgi:hypothetical protein
MATNEDRNLAIDTGSVRNWAICESHLAWNTPLPGDLLAGRGCQGAPIKFNGSVPEIHRGERP